MSIAVIAPEKFDFQDLVCIAVALSFWSRSGGSLLVEPDGGEDALLTLDDTAAHSTVEIQVKGTKNEVDLDFIVDCLLHFPDRKEEGCLLERLVGDPQRQILLVMSGRCDDGAKIFLKPFPWNGMSHGEGHFLVRDAEKILQNLQNRKATASATKLEQKRLKHARDLSHELERDNLRRALERILVLEQIDHKTLEDVVGRQLRNDFGISSERVSDVISSLRNAIKQAKSAKADAFPALRQTIAAATSNAIVSADYVDRGDELELEKALIHHRVLLLSGRPRTGKSSTARAVASRLQKHGYQIRETSDAQDAERYLLDPDGKERLVLLDDPLGGVLPARDAARTVERLEKLIPKLAKNRLLIVAQSQEQLFAVTRTASLDQAAIASLPWRDLGNLPVEFLTRLWGSLGEEWKVPLVIQRRVLAALKSGVLVLEPGCLSHLALNFRRLEVPEDLESAVRLAREDATTLSRAFSASPELEAVVRAIAVATRPDVAIARSDLAFIMGSGGDTLPSLPPTQFLSGIVYGGGAQKSPQFPQYEREPKLTTEASLNLEKLERLRYLRVSGDGAIGFAHPFYRAAAELTLEAPTYDGGQRILDQVRRALFCNGAAASKSSASNLDWLFTRTEKSDLVKKGILSFAEQGLRSDFPATRDFCFEFLMRHIQHLSREDRRKIPKWARAVTAVDLNTIEWDSGEARIPQKSFTGARDYVFRMLETIPKEDVAPVIETLNSGADLVSAECAVRALLYFSNHSAELSKSAMQRFLSYDEAFIRAEAVRIWLQQDRQDDGALLERIFSDTHPGMADAVIRGAIVGWVHWGRQRRDRVLAGVVSMASAPAASALLLSRLEVFNRPEYSGKNPPWELFAKLLPIVMRAVPVSAFVNDARLYGVIQDSQAALPPDAIVSICDAWTDWIEGLLDDGKLPSDYELGVVDVLLSATAKFSELRAGRVARLLALKPTGVLLTFIKDLVDQWSVLTGVERQLVRAKLSEGRVDQRWLQAGTLVRRSVPEELELLILGESLRLNSGPDKVLRELDTKLLDAALVIECGGLGVLQHLGIYHTGTDLWPGVLRLILKDSDHPQFALAVREAIFHVNDAQIVEAINSASANNLEQLFEILLRQRCTHTGNWLPRSWSALLRRAPDQKVRDAWYNRLADNAEAVIEGLGDIGCWLTEDGDRWAMLERLQGDVAIRTLVIRMDELPAVSGGGFAADTIRDCVDQLLRSSPPRLHLTYSELQAALKRHNIRDTDLDTAIENRRLESIGVTTSIRNRWRNEDPSMHPLDWVDP